MQLLNLALFWIFFGLASSHFAKKRGRAPLIWFFLGLFLGIFGLALVFLLPKVEKIPQKLPTLSPRKSDSWIKMWYYLDPHHTQQGPLDFPDFIKKWKENGLCEKSYIWGEGMQEWKQLSDLPDLVKELEQT